MSDTILKLTADVVTAALHAGVRQCSDVPDLIASTYAAFVQCGQPVAAAEPEIKPAVSVRSSVKPDALISLIDGKPYKMLRRHLTTHGYTEESYRRTFNLPRDYPMVAPNYTEQRRALAKKIGLGTKRTRA